ncbi:AtpZ/AtpI family protein [Candidatus Nomurabacteria bacterium]|nr:AtpZ/AtpI family protein [Candidatus Kaiserbacteria bacterium]MCB9813943.1 AtpZ/AtpI family protein [Candidatus Nomurabacteria bacterium]
MSQKNGFKISYALSIALQLGFLIVASLAGFIFLGMWIDSHLHTPPLFLVLGIVAGISVTIYEVYHMLIPLIKSDDEV